MVLANMGPPRSWCRDAGMAPTCTLWQRINVMQVMRALTADAYILHFLFCSYDARQVCQPQFLPPVLRLSPRSDRPPACCQAARRHCHDLAWHLTM